MRPLGLVAAVLVALTLAAPATGHAELRISDLDIFLNDQDVTVRAVVLGAVPPAFFESLQSGVPSHVRFTVELWRYSRMWPDRMVTSKLVERQLEYNVVTKEYKVAAVRGETRAPYATRDFRDAQRVLSEVRGLKLAPSSTLEAADVFYVRVLVEAALRGENTWLARWAGTAEQTVRRSDFRTISRDD